MGCQACKGKGGCHGAETRVLERVSRAWLKSENILEAALGQSNRNFGSSALHRIQLFPSESSEGFGRTGTQGFRWQGKQLFYCRHYCRHPNMKEFTCKSVCTSQ